VLKVLLIMPSTDVAVTAAELHCLVYIISSVIKISRSLSSGTCGNIISSSAFT